MCCEERAGIGVTPDSGLDLFGEWMVFLFTEAFIQCCGT